MLVLRSLLFNIAFYANILLWLVLLMPFAAMPRRIFMQAVKGWARSSGWLMETIVGTRVEIRGRENIPPGGLLVAAKHQSVWETVALLQYFDDPAYILKRELMWIPGFGWYVAKAQCVPINRKAGSAALGAMNERAREEVAKGRQIILFPEGTRRQAGAPPAYKYGVAHLYETLGVPCLPVAHNAGLYWPRRSFLRRPGTIRVEILPAIEPGLPRDAFFALVKERIEEASMRLYEEGCAELAKKRAP